MNIDWDDFCRCVGQVSQSASSIDIWLVYFSQSSLIDQMLSLASSPTRQKDIDNDQLDNLFLPTSWQSYYCCCYLFVFLEIFSLRFFWYISNQRRQQALLLTASISRIWHNAFLTNALSFSNFISHHLIFIWRYRIIYHRHFSPTNVLFYFGITEDKSNRIYLQRERACVCEEEEELVLTDNSTSSNFIMIDEIFKKEIDSNRERETIKEKARWYLLICGKKTSYQRTTATTQRRWKKTFVLCLVD